MRSPQPCPAPSHNPTNIPMAAPTQRLTPLPGQMEFPFMAGDESQLRVTRCSGCAAGECSNRRCCKTECGSHCVTANTNEHRDPNGVSESAP